jgi:hypothetical protein
VFAGKEGPPALPQPPTLSVTMKARCLPLRSRSATSRQPGLKYTLVCFFGGRGGGAGGGNRCRARLRIGRSASRQRRGKGADRSRCRCRGQQLPVQSLAMTSCGRLRPRLSRTGGAQPPRPRERQRAILLALALCKGCTASHLKPAPTFGGSWIHSMFSRRSVRLLMLSIWLGPTFMDT